ncbi:MAG: GxxExxY protein [Prevotella sp.]|nr:GxxExxY protein [Prevotellaceae bacterium]MDY5249676.1 GxxExxY protein [Prevotella sp.]
MNTMFLYKELTDKILRACYNVHNGLGCGFFEKVYQEALGIELTEMGIMYEREKHLPITYHGKILDCDYIADFVVEGKVILELKAVTEMNTLFEAQLINYMKATHIKVGYLINFGQERLYYKRYARY